MEIICNSIDDLIKKIMDYKKDNPTYDVLPADIPPYICYVADNGTEDCPIWKVHLRDANNTKNISRNDMNILFNNLIEYKIGNKYILAKTAEQAIKEYNRFYEEYKGNCFVDDEVRLTANWFNE